MKGIVFTEFLEMVEQNFSLDLADKIIEASDLKSGGAYTRTFAARKRGIIPGSEPLPRLHRGRRSKLVQLSNLAKQLQSVPSKH